tara:strand:+ start:10151 stop:11047 length:897 start_codon:yes stop_codon:yes gene_type:complete
LTHDLKSILTEIGYKLHDRGKEYRSRAIYRDSDNDTVLSIKKDTGRWIDFKEQRFGTLEELIKITLNLKDISEARQYLNREFNYQPAKVEKETLKTPTTFSSKNLDFIMPEYKYWNDRGVSTPTLKSFQSGTMKSGKMEGRYVFPIFDRDDKIVGMAGRALDNEKKPKWKLVGEKKLWAYPLKLNLPILQKEKKIILVESIGDMLALWEAGIKNTIVTFGLKVTAKIKQMLIAIRPNTIHIAFNNDANRAGNEGASKAYAELNKHFDTEQISISLPTHNDFGEMSRSDILLWKSQNNL